MAITPKHKRRRKVRAVIERDQSNSIEIAALREALHSSTSELQRTQQARDRYLFRLQSVANIVFEQRTTETGRSSELMNDGLLHCSFCSKDQHAVLKLIAGPCHCYICDECVLVCNQIIAEDNTKAAKAEGQ